MESWVAAKSITANTIAGAGFLTMNYSFQKAFKPAEGKYAFSCVYPMNLASLNNSTVVTPIVPQQTMIESNYGPGQTQL